MITLWMFHAVLVAALIAAAARACEEAFRAAGLPVRFVWLAAIVATLLLPSLVLLRDGPAVAVSGAAGAAHEAVMAPTPAAADGRGGPGSIVAAFADRYAALRTGVTTLAEPATARLYSALHAPGTARVAAYAWAALSALLLLHLAATFARLGRARRRCREHRIGAARVLISRGIGPAVIGLFRPAIVVPEWLLAAAPEDQRLVVLHEQEHVRARDHLVVGCAALAVALLPWNPALLWMLLRTRLAVELDCDARVLARGAAPRRYGGLLIDIAGRSTGSPLGAPALADSPSHLERRILAMSAHKPSHRRTRAAAFAAIALAFTAAACGTDMLTAADIAELDVAQLEATAQLIGEPQPGAPEPLFVVDGVAVTGDAARLIDPAAISRAEVVRGVAATELYGEQARGGVIALTTTAGDSQVDSADRRRRVDRETATLTRVPFLRGDGDVAEVRQLQTEAVPVTTPAADAADAPRPIFIVDGVIVTPTAFNALDPAAIESVDVVRGAAAIRLYGEHATHGVVRITTRPRQ